MSRYEWETATITLPAKEVATVKRLMRENINDLHAQVRERAVTSHKAAKTTSMKKYMEKMNIDRSLLSFIPTRGSFKLNNLRGFSRVLIRTASYVPIIP